MKNTNQDQEESVKSSGKTVEEAIKNGLAQLNLTKEQVEIEVITEGSRGMIFGLLGTEDAVVRLTPKLTLVVNDVSLPKEELPQLLKTEQVLTPNHKGNSNTTPEVNVVELDLQFGKRAQEVTETILAKMSIPATVSVRMGHDLVEVGERVPLTLDISGDNLGILIGRRGETLQALQFIVRQILSKEAGRWVPIIVDVEAYLVRRRKSLQQLAERMADKVVFSQRKVILEPMSSKERRIVHLHLRRHKKVYTSSVGDRDRRKVVILPK